MVDLKTKIGNITLKNPIMPASGTFSEDLVGVFDIELLGAHVAKTITAEKSGVIKTLNVVVGDNVETNDLLFKIDY